MHKLALQTLFAFILLSLLAFTTFASFQQSLLDWQGLVREPDRWWTLATLMDAYYGFITFYVWVVFKESRWTARIGWFVAIMTLGNMAMAAYVLRELSRLGDGEPFATLLTRRNL